jgi:hypothetical protein
MDFIKRNWKLILIIAAVEFAVILGGLLAFGLVTGWLVGP